MKNKIAALIIAIGFVLVAAGTSHNMMTPVMLQQDTGIASTVGKELGPGQQRVQQQMAAASIDTSSDVPTSTPSPFTLLLFGTGLVGLTSLGRWKTK